MGIPPMPLAVGNHRLAAQSARIKAQHGAIDGCVRVLDQQVDAARLQQRDGRRAQGA
jgi:hypothetical protein